MRARGQVRKASRVPPHAYCRALLIGPDPGGMKYKNRNKAPLPVPGEMLRYRIRDSGALLPARANKRTPAARYYRRSLPVSFFPPSSLSNVALPALPPPPCHRGPPRARTSCSYLASWLSAIFPPDWTFCDYRRKASPLDLVICSFATTSIPAARDVAGNARR